MGLIKQGTFESLNGFKYFLADFAAEYQKDSEIDAYHDREEDPVAPEDLFPIPGDEAVQFEADCDRLNDHEQSESDCELRKLDLKRR